MKTMSIMMKVLKNNVSERVGTHWKKNRMPSFIPQEYSSLYTGKTRMFLIDMCDKFRSGKNVKVPCRNTFLISESNLY